MLIVFNPPGILFILFLILFKPTEDLVQPPPTLSTEDPSQSYGPSILRAITSRAAYPSYMILFNPRPRRGWEIPARATDCWSRAPSPRASRAVGVRINVRSRVRLNVHRLEASFIVARPCGSCLQGLRGTPDARRRQLRSLHRE